MKLPHGLAIAVAAALVAGAACARPQAPRENITNNTDRAAADAILKADRDFNQAVADRDLNQFLSFVAEAATFNGGHRAARTILDGMAEQADGSWKVVYDTGSNFLSPNP